MHDGRRRDPAHTIVSQAKRRAYAQCVLDDPPLLADEFVASVKRCSPYENAAESFYPSPRPQHTVGPAPQSDQGRVLRLQQASDCIRPVDQLATAPSIRSSPRSRRRWDQRRRSPALGGAPYSSGSRRAAMASGTTRRRCRSCRSSPGSPAEVPARARDRPALQRLTPGVDRRAVRGVPCVVPHRRAVASGLRRRRRSRRGTRRSARWRWSRAGHRARRGGSP